jgi:predicted  nucleic acid-binding Zn-ribbon protein
MEQGHGDAESQLQQAKSEAKKLRDELTSASTKLKKAQGQIDQLNKAAMKNNASSYQQSIQLESQVLIYCIQYN